MKFLGKLYEEYTFLRGVSQYIKARLAERSTLAGISAAVAAGATIPSPYSYVIIGISTIAVFTPEKKPH